MRINNTAHYNANLVMGMAIKQTVDMLQVQQGFHTSYLPLGASFNFPMGR